MLDREDRRGSEIFQEQFQDGGLGRRRRLHVHDGGDGSARSRATALARRGSARLRIADARPAVRGEATIPQAVGSRARAPRARSLSFHRRGTRDTPGIGSRSSTSGSRLSASRRRRAASRVAVARASRPRPSTSSMRLRCARGALTRAVTRSCSLSRGLLLDAARGTPHGCRHGRHRSRHRVCGLVGILCTRGRRAAAKRILAFCKCTFRASPGTHCIVAFF